MSARRRPLEAASGRTDTMHQGRGTTLIEAGSDRWGEAAGTRRQAVRGRLQLAKRDPHQMVWGGVPEARPALTELGVRHGQVVVHPLLRLAQHRVHPTQHHLAHTGAHD